MNDTPIYDATHIDHVDQAVESEDEKHLQTLADLDAATEPKEQQ